MVENIGNGISSASYLLDQESRSLLPKMYGFEEEDLGLEAMAVIKFVASDSNWIWYATEFDGEDLFYGLIVGQETKVGFFRLSDLESLHDALGLIVEREHDFESQKLGQLIEIHKNER